MPSFRSLSKLFCAIATCTALLIGASACSHAEGWRKPGERPIRDALIRAKEARQERQASNATSATNFQGRDYILYRPSSVPAGEKVPLVLVLHGGMGNAQHMEGKLAGMKEAAQEYGFMVAYINGTHVMERKDTEERKGWNAGGCCGVPVKEGVDDVGYISRFIDSMVQNFNADPGRIYMTGHSNGAMMSLREACDSGKIAGVVSASGPLMVERCANPANNLRVLLIHGTEDEHVPINGGRGGKTATADVVFPAQTWTVDTLEKSGVSVSVINLEGTDHVMDNLDAALRSQNGKNLGRTMADFLMKP